MDRTLGPPRASLIAPVSPRATYPRGPLWSAALLPTCSAAGAAAERLQRPRGLRDPSARAAEAPRVRPGLARAERAGPRSASLNAHQLWSRGASALAPGPAGPRPPGRAEAPPPGPYDGDLLGEKGASRCRLLDGDSGGARSRRAAAPWDPFERARRSREGSIMRRRFPEAEFPV